MKYPHISKIIEVHAVILEPDEFLPVYVPAVHGGQMQIEIVVRKDGRVGIFFNEHIDVLSFAEEKDWINEGGE